MSFVLSRRAALKGAAAATAVFATGQAAHATLPGQTGKITFRCGAQVWIADADGGNAKRLLATAQGGAGSWSPDGSRYVYSVGNSPASIRADGTDQITFYDPNVAGSVSEPVYAYGRPVRRLHHVHEAGDHRGRRQLEQRRPAVQRP